jgi:hypothetical protein
MAILAETELLKRSSDSTDNLNIYKRFANISKGAIYINDAILEDINFIIIWNSCQYPVKYGRIY